MTDPIVNFEKPHFGDIPIACVIPSKTNPRKHFNDVDLAELAASIKQHGVAQPILVRPLPTTADMIDCVEIVAGERRYRACKLAGLDTIPAIVRELSDVQALEIQVVENLQRKDVHPIEEAEGYEQLMRLHDYKAEQLADKVGKSKAYIYARLKLCALPAAAREAFYSDKLNASTALLIARIPVVSLQEKATAEITNEHNSGHPMSYRRAVDHIQQRYMLDLDEARFNIQDAKLVKSAGACTTCPKRTGSQPELFPDVDGADVCTDPDCFASKGSAHNAKILAAAGKKGIPVHSIQDAWKVAKELDLALHSRMNIFERVADGVEAWKQAEDLIPADLLPPAVAYAKQNDGDLVAMYDKSALQRALEKAGLCLTLEQHTAAMQEKIDGGDGDEDIAPALKPVNPQVAQAEMESKYRRWLYKDIRSNLLKAKTPLEALRHAAKLIASEWSFPSELKDLYSFNTLSDEGFELFIEQASMNEVVVLMLEMAMGNDTFCVNHYDLDDNEHEDNAGYQSMLALATSCGIDAAAIRADAIPAPVEVELPTPDVEPDAPAAKSKKKAKAAPKAAATPNADAWPFPTRAQKEEVAQ